MAEIRFGRTALKDAGQQPSGGIGCSHPYGSRGILTASVAFAGDIPGTREDIIFFF
jgi:hypothetical protein